MSKKIVLLIFCAVLFLSALSVFAQYQPHAYGPPISLAGMLDSFMWNIWIIFAAFAVVCFLIAGGKFLTAQGDPGQLKIARAAFVWGVVGVVVGIVSYSIITVVGSLVGL